MTNISNTKEFYETLEKHDKLIVYFYTAWCPDCFVSKQFLPHIEELYKDITFVQMDRDQDIELAKHLEIFGIPSFLYFEHHEEKARLVNKKRKTFEEVKAFIDSVL